MRGIQQDQNMIMRSTVLCLPVHLSARCTFTLGSPSKPEELKRDYETKTDL